MENVVDVGRDDQSLDRKTHPRRYVPCKNITEISGGHAEGELALRSAKLERGGKVIDHLGHQPRPVNRIDRTDAVLRNHVLIGEDTLHHRLRIVEAALDCDIVDIGRTHRRHLAALDVAHPALGVKHENLDIL